MGTPSMKVFEPEDVDQLLRGWLLHARKGRERHDRAARRCDRRRLLIGGSASVVSAIVGTSVFVALEKHSSDTRITVGVALLGILAAILTSLSAFLNLAERAEKHRSAGVGYKEIIRELERILSVPVGDITNTDPVVVAVQQRLDQLEEHAAVVPEGLNAWIDAEWLAKGIHVVTRAADLYKPQKKTHGSRQSEDADENRKAQRG